MSTAVTRKTCSSEMSVHFCKDTQHAKPEESKPVSDIIWNWETPGKLFLLYGGGKKSLCYKL